MNGTPRMAPGWPGIEPRWTSSAKSAVGTALGDGSRVWFTASHGILNEVYYPEVDTACLRDAGLLVTAADGFFSEEKRDCNHAVEWMEPGVPAFRMVNSCRSGRYVIEKRTCTSPEYDVVLQQVTFTPLVGTLDDYTLTLVLSPHLGNHGAGNTGWTGQHRGHDMLFAQRQSLALAVACSAPFTQGTVGFVGPHDAWHDVRAHGSLTNIYDRAENGNIALAAQIDARAVGGSFTIAIGFGADPEIAALHARAALFDSFGDTEARYAHAWRAWQSPLHALDELASDSEPHLYRASTAVMKSHMSMNNDGGAIASLSVPWGSSKGDGDLGGYHLVWPRDMVETAGGLLAADAHLEMKAMLRFLAVTQEANGRWPQNMWLNGAPYWTGLQLDEVAFPILLVDHARRAHAIDVDEVEQCWGMVQRAAVFVALHGPATDQDRWEENAGYTPFTIAVEIAGLLAAADLAELAGDARLASYLRDTADDWNASIEHWMFAEGSWLAERLGVSGHYVRVGSALPVDAASPTNALVRVKNRGADVAPMHASELISVDALALVRFGLRSALDPRMLATVRVIDAVLQTDTATGPTWRRYNEDGYGEHEDGRAFDGTGIGRGWPLLAGERAHYELAAGRPDAARALATVMRAQANAGGMLPEQVWDAPDIVARELRNGGPTGSAMPLVWAHAEYVKLLRSLKDGAVSDCPPQPHARYVVQQNTPRVTAWSFSHQATRLARGRVLRIDVKAPARVRWSSDAWATYAEHDTDELSHGLHTVDLPTSALVDGSRVLFTLYWLDANHWEGRDFGMTVVP